MTDFKVPPKKENDENETMRQYVTALTAVSPPTIPSTTGGAEFEFEDSCTSGPLLDLKRSKRHMKAAQLLHRDPMLIVPVH